MPFLKKKCSGEVKSKSSSKKKQRGKNIKERELYQRNYIHASEAFLSILLDKDKSSSTILSLKKAGPEITELLTVFYWHSWNWLGYSSVSYVQDGYRHEDSFCFCSTVKHQCWIWALLALLGSQRFTRHHCQHFQKPK